MLDIKELNTVAVCPLCGKVVLNYKLPNFILETVDGTQYHAVRCDRCNQKLIASLGDPFAALTMRYKFGDAYGESKAEEVLDVMLDIFHELVESGNLQDASDFAKEHTCLVEKMGYVSLVTIVELVQLVVDTARQTTKIDTETERQKYREFCLMY